MRDVIDRYVRSLAERELEDDAPERLHDLGTFLDWLLERQGYAVLLRAFKHAGTARRKSAGRLQLGVDIVATKPDADGVDRLYRFVLKHGPVGRSEWNKGDEVGSLVSDLHEAARRNVRRDAEDHAFPLDRFERTSVVAVHNGDFDTETLGGSRMQLRQRLLDTDGVDLVWWDARELSQMALLPPAERGSSLDDEADASFFPPAMRPFARMALDSLRVTRGRAFDLATVDGLLQAVLPLRVRVDDDDQLPAEVELEKTSAPRLRRQLGTLTVFIQMLIVESRTAADGLTLPVLDSIERVLSRAMMYVGALERANGSPSRPIRDLLSQIVDQYVRTASTLRERLRPLLDRPNALAVASNSECVDYPLRVLRFAGYLAVAGLACIETSNPRIEDAREFADAIVLLWSTDGAGCASPVTDDQVIELGCIWELLLRLGRAQEAASMCNDVVQRLVVRRHLQRPLPAAYQGAHVPMRPSDLRDLLEAYLVGSGEAIVDAGSTLAPLAFFLAHRLGIDLAPELLAAFKKLELGGGQSCDACHLQVWQPPPEAGATWYYADALRHRGVALVFHIAPKAWSGARRQITSVEELAAEFESFARPLAPSVAMTCGLPAIDRMAWKLFRVRPPMHVFIDLVRPAS